jgi:hypothetical protein
VKKSTYYKKLVKAAEEGKLGAVDYQGVCTLIADDGRRCALGLLLTPKVMREHLLFPHSSVGEIPPEVYPEGLEVDDMVRIQRAHDTSVSNLRLRFSKTKFLRQLRKLDCFRDEVARERREKKVAK